MVLLEADRILLQKELQNCDLHIERSAKNKFVKYTAVIPIESDPDQAQDTWQS